MKKTFKTVALVLFMAAGLGESRAADVGVQIKHIVAKFVFDPTNVVVARGDRVIWTNTEATIHDTTHAGQPRLWASGNMGLNATFAYTFTNTGYFPYVCLQHVVAHPEQTGSVTVVSVANVFPTASIATPTNTSSFAAPATITINANATDSDGTVTNVQFFNGAASLGSDTTNPYSFTWNNVAAGTYTLTVRATDNLGASTTSAPVTISVINSPPNPVALTGAGMAPGRFTFSFPSQTGVNYAVQSSGSLAPPNWQTFTNVVGSGSTAQISHSTVGSSQRFYRVRAE